MGICDFRGKQDNVESSQVMLDDGPSAAKHSNQFTFKGHENENAAEDNAKLQLNESNSHKKIFSNPDMNSEDIVNDVYNNDDIKSLRNADNPEITSGRVISDENIIVNKETNDPLDQINTSVDEVVTSVQPVIVNKKKWENCKVEHPLKKNLMSGIKILLKAQVNTN